jgi:hypothetical protein
VGAKAAAGLADRIEVLDEAVVRIHLEIDTAAQWIVAAVEQPPTNCTSWTLVEIDDVTGPGD